MTDHQHLVCPDCGAVNRLPATRLAEHPSCGKCRVRLFTGKPTALGDDAFERHLTRNDVPLLVDFWAEWCGPCKMMAPEFEKAAEALEPRLRLAKVDTEQAGQTAGRFAVRSIPTLILFKGGREVARQAGAMRSGDIVSWVEGALRGA